MEVVISCMVSELMSTALGTRPAADIGGGESPVGEGVEMIGNAARCEKTAEGEKRGQYGSVSINMPPPDMSYLNPKPYTLPTTPSLSEDPYGWVSCGKVLKGSIRMGVMWKGPQIIWSIDPLRTSMYAVKRFILNMLHTP